MSANRLTAARRPAAAPAIGKSSGPPGLGLAIVQDVVEAYGWILQLDTSDLGGLRATIQSDPSTATTSDRRLFSGEQRTSHFKRVRSVHDDPQRTSAKGAAYLGVADFQSEVAIVMCEFCKARVAIRQT
jgi:hypothetical protein